MFQEGVDVTQNVLTILVEEEFLSLGVVSESYSYEPVC